MRSRISIRGYVRPSVRPSVGPSHTSSISEKWAAFLQNSIRNSSFFLLFHLVYLTFQTFYFVGPNWRVSRFFFQIRHFVIFKKRWQRLPLTPYRQINFPFIRFSRWLSFNTSILFFSFRSNVSFWCFLFNLLFCVKRNASMRWHNIHIRAVFFCFFF